MTGLRPSPRPDGASAPDDVHSAARAAGAEGEMIMRTIWTASRQFSGASLLALALSSPSLAQTTDANATGDPVSAAEAQQATPPEDQAGDIIVTAQRSSQRLQDVPIAVSAFSAQNLEQQQIRNTSDLQLSLPNITFSKGNFTGASFTIRGIGDLCVGVSCDSATAIHMNDAPLFSTRIFETEFFDLERVEVLRGPQGTLFGRNATSGVINFITARPDPDAFGAAGEFEYGNYNSIKARGMVNVPIGDNAAIRVAGIYLNRDGYTRNLYDNTRMDGRDLFGVRGSFRWEPSDRTTIDLMGYYFRENDDRMRITRQLCQRDPTGVLGCLNQSRDAQVTNGNSTVAAVLTSREFFAIRGIPTAFALGSLYGTDVYANSVNPSDVREVNTDYPSLYYADEMIFQASLRQDLGNGLSVRLLGNYQETGVDSSQDYNLSVQNRALATPGLTVLAGAAAGAIPGLPAAYFRPIAQALIPGGPGGQLCTSAAEPTNTGAFGGSAVCAQTPLDFDRSNAYTRSWSAEGLISSDWDGPFNFLVGGIYSWLRLTENSYYVNAFQLDYAAGLLGAFSAFTNPPAAGGPLPPSFLASPFYRNNTNNFLATSYGLFGEAYVDLADRLKLTLGVRYNNDHKEISARTTLASFLTPFGTSPADASPYLGAFDADPATAGNQPFQVREANFDAITGRAVLDFQVTPDNLLYLSYSRGYKSGGINPPLSPIFAVAESFEPESVDAFEIGSKNAFGGLQLNLTGFYYRYNGLQLSRIVARTSVNDNVSANIWGVEAEAIIQPTRDMLVNLGFSYLNTEVSEDKFLPNPRDPGGGRADAVIIKDITNASHCAVASRAGSVAGVNGFVTQINNLINAGAIPGVSPGAGLRGPQPFGPTSGIASTGAFSICAALQATAATVGPAFGGIEFYGAGVPVNIRGNQLPQAPTVKWSAGAQYTFRFDNEMTLVPRVDVTYTGDSYGNIFNGNVNRIEGYAQANAQVQLNGPSSRWYARAFIQNIFDSNATTGLYVTDATSGNFTNIFTLEPRRYGVAVGFRF